MGAVSSPRGEVLFGRRASASRETSDREAKVARVRWGLEGYDKMTTSAAHGFLTKPSRQSSPALDRCVHGGAAAAEPSRAEPSANILLKKNEGRIEAPKGAAIIMDVHRSTSSSWAFYFPSRRSPAGDLDEGGCRRRAAHRPLE